MKSRVLFLSLFLALILGACDEVKTSDSCGDGFLDPGEVCDQSEFLFAACADYGYYEQHGELACAADCSLAAGVCVGRCGDGEVQMEHEEQCEGIDLKGNSCVSLGYSGGVLSCGADCRFDLSACVSSCGNGIVDVEEDCDDGNQEALDGCSDLCAVENGFACTGTPSVCVTTCGDGLVAGDEVCDGADLRGRSCAAEGAWFGTMVCAPGCRAVEGCGVVAELSAGEGHVCARLEDGEVWCWGLNEQGQLGDGTTDNRTTPVPVTGLPAPAVGISAGVRHTCAALADGDLWCWGLNDFGQLGDGTTIFRPTPGRVTGLFAGVVQVAAGLAHTCAVLDDESAWCWGGGAQGQLGDGLSSVRAVTPVAVAALASVAGIVTGDQHTCAWKADGSVSCWGLDNYNQLGDGTGEPSATPKSVLAVAESVFLSAGTHHTCSVDVGGGLVCWGRHELGQLGLGDLVTHPAPETVTGVTATAVVAAMSHTCVLDDGVRCWGANDVGQLGDGTYEDRLDPVSPAGMSAATRIAAGVGFTCAVVADGGVWCWGYNPYGQLGQTTTDYRSNVPVRVTPPSP